MTNNRRIGAKYVWLLIGFIVFLLLLVGLVKWLNDNNARYEAYNRLHPYYCAQPVTLVSASPVAAYNGSISDYSLTWSNGQVTRATDPILYTDPNQSISGLGFNQIVIGKQYCLDWSRL